ncbi:MAG: DUF87 domain-containing protein [Clostridiales bacterium]|nr:DUF87 domain-containing protein [Clostridiales bacterium]
MADQILYGDRIVPNVPVSMEGARFALIGTNQADEPIAWPISMDTLSKHMLFLGAIGTGKSNAMNNVIRSVRGTMTNQDIMLVFDTKGDYYKEFYRPGDIVFSNDARATNGVDADYWNLFGEITIDGQWLENATEIVKTIFADRLERTSQPFFPNAAKDLLLAIVMHLCRGKQDASKNNEVLLQMLQGATSQRLVALLRQHPDMSGMIPYVQDPKSGQTLGVISELQSATRELLVGNFARNGSMSMRQLIRKKGGKIIFVEYDLGIGGVLTPIYRLLFDLAIKEALCRTRNEGNVYFVMDEFSLLPQMMHIDDGVNFGRSLGARFLIGAQNIGQIYNAYGEDRASSLLSGFTTTICFRLNDGRSREFFKELCGKNGRITSYAAAVRSKGEIDQYREAYVVEDHDIANLRTGEAIIHSGQYPPFRFRFKKFE